jgi:4-amino-4-deoxy-L-arabinose transferase-like glycosyltransferase
MARQAKTTARKTAKSAKKPGRATAKTAKMTEDPRWMWRVLGLLCAVAAAHEVWNLIGLIPVHFDEAQYWAYGEAPDFGYYSKPPLAAWVIRASTDLFGETEFGLRAFAPLLHLWIGWMIFVTGRRLFDGRVGFWAAAGYALAPGVSVSSALMSTDPVMMAGWALALYALVRGMEAKGIGWWILVGLGVGLGMLAKYTAIAFALGGLGYALFGREGAFRRREAIVASVAALIVLSPNLIWNALNGFATIGHLGENAGGSSGLRPDRLAEFVGAQFAVIGPVFFAAILAAVLGMGWRGDWRLRLLVWMTAPLLAAMSVQALLSKSNPNWAAPAFVAGSILAAHWLVTRDWRRGLIAQCAVGVVAVLALWIGGAVYASWGTSLPRAADPFKKMRVGGPFCEHVLAAMEAEGIEVMLSDNRRRLSECLWEGRLPIESIAVFDPDGVANNHYELKARLEAGDRRPMILAMDGSSTAALIAAQFEAAEELESGRFRTHSDREEGYSIWRVEGFHGY